MSRFSIIVLTLTLLAGIVGCSQAADDSNSKPQESESQSTGNSTKDEYFGLTGITVHTANGYTESFADSQFHAFDPLLQDIESLNWIAPRGGANFNTVDMRTVKSADIQAIVESSKDKPDYKGDFIRLKYDPQIPETGQNWHGHQDILVYQDSENDQDAYLAVQDPEQVDQWDVYKFSEYGQWLAKELAILLRVGFGY